MNHPRDGRQLQTSPASIIARRYARIGRQPSTKWRRTSFAGTVRRWRISNRGSHGWISTSARQIARTSMSPLSWPLMHWAREKPRRRTVRTAAQASSAISRRRVSSQSSEPSGPPPGRSHRTPSPLTRTTPASAVTQIPVEPRGLPLGGESGTCHVIIHSWPSVYWRTSSPSPSGRSDAHRSAFYARLSEQKPARPPAYPQGSGVVNRRGRPCLQPGVSSSE
jgi:hypothetical protein